MGEAPHEVYTDAELKARAEPRCGNCKWYRPIVLGGRETGDGDCVNKLTGILVEYVTQDFGCIHFEPKT